MALVQNKTTVDLQKEDLRNFVRHKAECLKAPASVYRFQFHRDFKFRQAAELIPYLKRMGFEAIYSSPIFQAVPGSLHGYNVTNPAKINPELGSEEDFEYFAQVLRQHQMSLVLDVVPNHMGITGNENDWWNDVLENGPTSEFAPFFDIDWEPLKPELKNKVLIPVLGDYYGAVLENGDLKLAFEDGQLKIAYFENRYPVAPDTYALILGQEFEALSATLHEQPKRYAEFVKLQEAITGMPPRTEFHPQKRKERYEDIRTAKEAIRHLVEKSDVFREYLMKRLAYFNGDKNRPKSFDPLHQLLSEQSYRLSYWRVAAEEINYRRFFNINELAAIRMEDVRVFEHYHRLLFKLIREGIVSGIRIDHPDGLYDPAGYFKKLQATYLYHEWLRENDLTPEALGRESITLMHDFLELLEEKEFAESRPLLIVAEKILDRKERLPQNWNIHGTVGYEFMNFLNGIFVKQDQEKTMDAIYEEFIGQRIEFDEALHNKKKFFALVYMASEINSLGHRLDMISEHHRKYRDLTRNNLTLAIRETIAAFPVYRTYIGPHDAEVSERDKKYISIAIAKARQKSPALDPAVYDFLKQVLLLELEKEIPAEERELYRDFVLRFQQLTGPIMAKGLEDTVFYIYNRLLSLNEVGGDPTHFGNSADDFHKQNQDKAEKWPYAFLASTTHDTKRSEDVRARLNVLSELPEEWKTSINRWAILNEKHKTLLHEALEPRRNMEYFIYQTLVGAWPAESISEDQFPAFAERIWQYLLKSSREAKVYTNWVNPNLEYEEAVRKFLCGILSQSADNNFLTDFLTFQKKIAGFGLLNSLSAAVLKIASPGIVDNYQGCETVSLSLVDPDNRRPVDYSAAKGYLEEFERKENTGYTRETLARELFQTFQNGKLKFYVHARGLEARREYGDLFLRGDYLPLRLSGEKASNAIAFLRSYKNQKMIAVGARFFTGLIDENGNYASGIWKDTSLQLPNGRLGDAVFHDLFTSKTFQPRADQNGGTLLLSDLLSVLPAGIFIYSGGT